MALLATHPLLLKLQMQILLLQPNHTAQCLRDCGSAVPRSALKPRRARRELIHNTCSGDVSGMSAWWMGDSVFPHRILRSVGARTAPFELLSFTKCML